MYSSYSSFVRETFSPRLFTPSESSSYLSASSSTRFALELASPKADLKVDVSSLTFSLVISTWFAKSDRYLTPLEISVIIPIIAIFPSKFIAILNPLLATVAAFWERVRLCVWVVKACILALFAVIAVLYCSSVVLPAWRWAFNTLCWLVNLIISLACLFIAIGAFDKYVSNACL